MPPATKAGAGKPKRRQGSKATTPAEGSVQAEARQELQAAVWKTRFCSFFSQGACTRGDKCTYAHNDEELRESPNFAQTKLCRTWRIEGRCHRGAECAFAHGPQELRIVHQSSLATPPTQLPSESSTTPRSSEDNTPTGPLLLKLDQFVTTMPQNNPMGVTGDTHMMPMRNSPLSDDCFSTNQNVLLQDKYSQLDMIRRELDRLQQYEASLRASLDAGEGKDTMFNEWPGGMHGGGPSRMPFTRSQVPGVGPSQTTYFDEMAFGMPKKVNMSPAFWASVIRGAPGLSNSTTEAIFYQGGRERAKFPNAF